MVNNCGNFKPYANFINICYTYYGDDMKKYLLAIISIFFLLTTNVSAKETVKFSKCIDGDTFKVKINNEDVKVRMLAVDAPETAKDGKPADYYADEAAEYTCNRLKKAKKIQLEYDDKSDKTDKYGRYLAWVFVDGSLLEEELVSGGYAKVAYLYSDYKYADSLKEKQEIASAKNLGIWDTEAAFKYDSSSSKETTNEVKNEKNENIEVVIVVIIFLIITFITKLFKKK